MFRTFPLGGQRQTRVPVPGEQRLQPRGVRQSCGRHHRRHVRTDHRHRWRRLLSGAPAAARASIPVLRSRASSVSVTRPGGDRILTGPFFRIDSAHVPICSRACGLGRHISHGFRSRLRSPRRRRAARADRHCRGLRSMSFHRRPERPCRVPMPTRLPGPRMPPRPARSVASCTPGSSGTARIRPIRGRRSSRPRHSNGPTWMDWCCSDSPDTTMPLSVSSGR